MSSWDGTIHFAQVFQQNVAEIGFEVDLEESNLNMEGQDKRDIGEFRPSTGMDGNGDGYEPSRPSGDAAAV